MNNGKQAYRQLCMEEAAIPLFLRDWWLDATCGQDGWGVSLVTSGSEIQAALPYRIKRRFGFTALTQPALTPRLGPWFRPISAKTSTAYSRQKDLMTDLIGALPRYHYYRQNWNPSITNWLPFHWRGFDQTTRYTYVIDNLNNKDDLWSGLRENIRTDIRKAEGRFGIKVDTDAPLEELIELNKLTFLRQGINRPFSSEYVKRIDAECSRRNCRRIFVARGPDGRPHAGAYVVWDNDTAYYLMGGGDPQLRNSGATSLCLWEAISFSGQVAKKFDFEGSMIEPIERFFRAFGAKQLPYFQVRKTSSKMLGLVLAIKSAATAS